jgi:recombination protein RecT
MSTAVTTMESTVLGYENSFNAVNAYKLNFKKEAGFALQILKGNNYLRETAQKNPDALQAAITNIAAIGISLNPAVKEAYLVPRGNQVCLDISYIGLIKLATDTGSIVWVQAEIVKKNDKFTYLGVGKAPVHEMDPFGDRGETIGVYVVAKLSTGEFLSTAMSKKECDDIREKSSQASKNGPWVTFYEEMLKKTVIKRASKLWPKSERLDTAVEVLNQHEGIDFNGPKAPHVDLSAYDSETPTDKTFANLRANLAAKGRTEEALLTYLKTQFKDANITKLEDLNSAHVEYSYRMLTGGSK